MERELYPCCFYELKSQKLEFVYWALLCSVSRRHQLYKKHVILQLFDSPSHSTLYTQSVGLFHSVNSVLSSALSQLYLKPLNA